MEKLKEKNQDINEKASTNEFAWKKMKEEIGRIKYGSVTAVIHEGKIVQIDTNTKIRLT